MRTNTERIESLCSIGALMRGKQKEMGEIKTKINQKIQLGDKITFTTKFTISTTWAGSNRCKKETPIG